MTLMQNTLFQISVAFHLLAALLFLRGRGGWALFCLLAGGIIMRFYFVGLDPFLHDWDERFHALVAKNLSHHFLTPTLIDHPILPYDPTNWVETHIWLHKQPLFLWQMALSIKLFGATEWAVRLPSLLMTSAMIPVVYLMGKQLFDKNTGFIAAFIFSCYEPLLEMNSGMMSMDHNDIAFLFYVSCSICAWIYFERTGRLRFVLLMGFFSGCAVLNKWLTGLLIFAGFAFYHFFLIRDLFTRDTLKHLALALLVCLVTFVPWQVYILLHFPVEAHHEYEYNSRHLYTVVEGHGHETWFYFTLLQDYYKGFQWLILAGVIYAFAFAARHRLALTVALMACLIYAFFTIAQTKLPSYVMVVVPVCLIFIAKVVELLMHRILRAGAVKYIFGTLCFALLFYLFMDMARIRRDHFIADNWEGGIRTYKMGRADAFRKLAGHLPPSTVLTNVGNLDFVDAMFYTDHTCYGVKGSGDYELLKKKGYHIVYWGDSLPSYLQGQSNATLAKEYLK